MSGEDGTQKHARRPPRRDGKGPTKRELADELAETRRRLAERDELLQGLEGLTDPAASVTVKGGRRVPVEPPPRDGAVKERSPGTQDGGDLDRFLGV